MKSLTHLRLSGCAPVGIYKGDRNVPLGYLGKYFLKSKFRNLLAKAIIMALAIENVNILACVDKTVSWYNKNYTFIALALRKNT